MSKVRLGVLFGALAVVVGGSALASEEVSYKVIKKYRDFELRKYDSYLVAETEVKTDFDSAANKAFGLLVGYIGGENVKKEEISMTSPVNQQSSGKEGEKIAMTSPVTQIPGSESDGEKSYIVSFVMPAKYNIKNIPDPVDPRVKIREVPSKLMAARTYSGTWSRTNYLENEKALLDALEEAGLKTVGLPIYARYDPPWTLWFNRRNEVIIEVEAPK